MKSLVNMKALSRFACFAVAISIVQGAQRSLGTAPNWPVDTSYDAGLFTPLGDLLALSSTEYTVLRHPKFPTYSVRIKRSHFCDGIAESYTGYIDIEARHLFFYFFESRRDPDTDDVIFWTNGGPGGSSSLGLFTELGPCRVTGPNSTERFKESWNNHANVFFIDQPVGVGFSYVDHGEQVSSTAEAAEDISAFVAIFFEHFSKFKGRSFHMAGESYAGRYIPVFASAIYDQNAQLVETGMTPINLTSVMIGNGGTDMINMLLSQYDIQCMDYGFPAITPISECIRMKQLLPRYKKKLQDSCIDIYDSIDCGDAWTLSDSAISALFNRINPYDATRPCSEDPSIEACYPIIQYMNDYLNTPEVQLTLGIDPRHGNYSFINFELNARFAAKGDFYSFRADHYLEALLERGIRVLVYVGANDWMSNWVYNERLTLRLEFAAQDAFRGAPLREWTVDGEVAGKTRSGGGLTFATINDAGHMAPFDQPLRSLELTNRWLAGQEL